MYTLNPFLLLSLTHSPTHSHSQKTYEDTSTQVHVCIIIIKNRVPHIYLNNHPQWVPAAQTPHQMTCRTKT